MQSVRDNRASPTHLGQVDAPLTKTTADNKGSLMVRLSGELQAVKEIVDLRTRAVGDCVERNIS